MATATKKAKKARRKFSDFNAAEALKLLQVTELFLWEIDYQPLPPSPFFLERLRRLKNFDLVYSQRAKELLIDAFCEEVAEQHPQLKIWKAAALQSDELTGVVDYMIAPRIAYLATPLLCVVEAKKDDFEKGMAQCLVEMKACQWNNEQAGIHIDTLGIVTNGEGWKFYKLTAQNQAFETLLYSLSESANVLGLLHYIFGECEKHLAVAGGQ